MLLFKELHYSTYLILKHVLTQICKLNSHSVTHLNTNLRVEWVLWVINSELFFRYQCTDISEDLSPEFCSLLSCSVVQNHPVFILFHFGCLLFFLDFISPFVLLLLLHPVYFINVWIKYSMKIRIHFDTHC